MREVSANYFFIKKISNQTEWKKNVKKKSGFCSGRRKGTRTNENSWNILTVAIVWAYFISNKLHFRSVATLCGKRIWLRWFVIVEIGKKCLFLGFSDSPKFAQVFGACYQAQVIFLSEMILHFEQNVSLGKNQKFQQ